MLTPLSPKQVTCALDGGPATVVGIDLSGRLVRHGDGTEHYDQPSPSYEGDDEDDLAGDGGQAAPLGGNVRRDQ